MKIEIVSDNRTKVHSSSKIKFAFNTILQIVSILPIISVS